MTNNEGSFVLYMLSPSPPTPITSHKKSCQKKEEKKEPDIGIFKSQISPTALKLPQGTSIANVTHLNYFLLKLKIKGNCVFYLLFFCFSLLSYHTFSHLSLFPVAFGCKVEESLYI